MGEHIRSKDWSSSPVGSPNDWHPSLKTALSIILNADYPMFIWWGKEDLTMFNNDAYIPVLGKKHPLSLGSSARKEWAEIWDDIGEVVKEVFEGKPFYAQDMRLLLGRKGFLEETYWTFSYSPIFIENGEVGGLFCACLEVTNTILGQRRLKVLSHISELPTDATDLPAIAKNSAAVMAENAFDIPWLALYLFSEKEERLDLTFQNHGNEMGGLLPTSFLPKDSEAGRFWLIEQILGNSEPVLLEGLPEKVPGFVQHCPDCPSRAMVLPLKKNEQGQHYGILICGISDQLIFDEEYNRFVNLAARQVATVLADVAVREEERKRIQMLQELDRAKTVFFNNISHEFRTPLTLMFSPLEEAIKAAESRQAPQPELDNLYLLHRNTRRLMKLVNNLLDFSRIEAGRMEAAFQPTNLAVFTADLASSFRAAVENAGLLLKVNAQALEEIVYVDRNMWEKIVLNLLSNAFKYTLEGSISVQVSSYEGHAVLTISDTGVGISEAELPHVFERFYRAQNKGGRTHEGSGIGLSLVKELVKMHGGDIGIESEVGEGTRITIKIPFGKKHLPDEQVKEDTSIAGPENALDPTWLDADGWDEGRKFYQSFEMPFGKTVPGSRKKILISDDNADMRRFLCRILEKQYEVISTANGKRAWEEIQGQLPDLILADIMMPEMDGIELLERVRNDQRTANIPVIFLSARAGEEEVVKGIDTGADDYLVKPFSSKELLARIEANLKKVQGRDLLEQNLRNVFEQASVALCMLNGPDHVIKMANDKALELWDREREKTIGKTVAEVFPELVPQGFLQLYERIYETGERFISNENPIQLFRKGKLEQAYINFIYEPMRDLEGKVSGIMALGVEVTEQVMARKALENSERNFRNLIAQAPVAICIYQGPDFIIQLANAECLELWDKTADEVIGKSLFDIHPHTSEQVDMYHRVLFGGERLVFNESPIAWSHNKRGDIGWYNFVLEPLRNLEGEIYGVMGLGVDVTDQVSARKQIEESEKRLQLAIDIANIGLWEFDFNKQVFNITPRTREFFGFLPDDVLTIENASMGVAEEDRQQALDAFKKAIQPGSDGIYEAEHSSVGLNGHERRYLKAKGQTLFNDDGTPRHFIGTVVDVSIQRKMNQMLEREIALRTDALHQANLELRQTNQAFEHAEQIGKFGSYTYDLSSKKATWSDNFYRVLGCLPGEFEPNSSTFFNFVHPDDLNAVKLWQKELIDNKTIGDWTYRIIRKDGSMIWVRGTGKLVYNEDGSSSLIGNLQDITEEKNKELELRRQKNFVTALIDASIDYITVFDTETRFLLLNKKSENALGLPRKEILGKKLLEIAPVAVAAHQNIQLALQGKTTHTPLYRSPINGMLFETYYVPLYREDGQIYAAFVIAHDATAMVEAREKLEAVVAKNKELEEFAYLASHDLREPLNTIRSYADLLESEHNLDPDMQQYISFIKSSADRLNNLIQDLLEHSRIGSHGPAQMVGFGTVLQEVLQDLQATILDTKAKVIIGEMPTLWAYPKDIRLLFQNLISNAIKFQKPGEVPAVKVSAEKTRDAWHFIVQDNGIGIEERFQERVFLIFQRLHTDMEYEGTGIGLAHCKKIVDLHGGKLWLESEFGNGSKFHFTIPLEHETT